MRDKPSAFLESCRDNLPGPWFSDERFGNNGRFVVTNDDRRIVIVASDGGGWDHVSVSVLDSPKETPTWDDMCYAKSLFFRGDEWVVQFHPPPSMNRNYHPGCLHLWRWQGGEFPTPDPNMVAPA